MNSLPFGSRNYKKGESNADAKPCQSPTLESMDGCGGIAQDGLRRVDPLAAPLRQRGTLPARPGRLVEEGQRVVVGGFSAIPDDDLRLEI